MTDEKKGERGMAGGSWLRLAIATAIGVAVGMATDNIGIGIAVGIVLGIVLTAGERRRAKSGRDEE